MSSMLEAKRRPGRVNRELITLLAFVDLLIEHTLQDYHKQSSYQHPNCSLLNSISSGCSRSYIYRSSYFHVRSLVKTRSSGSSFHHEQHREVTVLTSCRVSETRIQTNWETFAGDADSVVEAAGMGSLYISWLHEV